MYNQIDGVAMGSPLGPILANIFDGYHEKRIQSHPWPQVYDRYVDDIFSHFLSKEACNEFFVTLNNLHPALKFTREDEQDDSLPFLDVLVNRMAQEFSTSIYRKPTFTGLYTPWDSFSATRYKTNTVRALVNRAVRICSPSLLDDELENIRRIFLRNGYPGSVLEKMVSNKQHETYRPKEMSNCDSSSMAWTQHCYLFREEDCGCCTLCILCCKGAVCILNATRIHTTEGPSTYPPRK